jgi:hypothetical protein
MKIRVVKTASKARAVQVVRYQNNKRIILRHIGSAHTDAELEELMRIGHEWMKNYSDQLSIFPDETRISYYTLITVLLSECNTVISINRYVPFRTKSDLTVYPRC